MGRNPLSRFRNRVTPERANAFPFDAAGLRTRIDDGRGNVHDLTYNASGLLETVSDGLGRTLTFSYDEATGSLSA